MSDVEVFDALPLVVLNAAEKNVDHILRAVSSTSPQPHDAPFDIDTFELIDPPWPAISEWIPTDENDPLAVFPEDIVSTHWVPKEIRLDDERTLAGC